MTINYTSLIKYIMLIAILLLLTGCNKSKSEQDLDCFNDGISCSQFQSKRTKVTVYTQEILVENLYSLTLQTQQPIVKLDIEGVSMNMGVIPVVLQKQQNKSEQVYRGQFMLGICSEPEMVWAFVITYDDGKIEKIPFRSKWVSDVK